MLPKRNKDEVIVTENVDFINERARRKSLCDRYNIRDQFLIRNKHNSLPISNKINNNLRFKRFYENNSKKMNQNNINKNSLEAINFLLVSHRKKAIDVLVSKMKIEYKSEINQEFEDHEKKIKKSLQNKRCIFRGGEGWRVNWDLFIMFLAIYNCFAIPVQFAFNPEFSNHPAYIAVDSIINLIFIIDVIINFRTTFIHKITGEEIIDIKKIAINYIKSRFLIDLIASIPFDSIVNIIISTGNTSTLNLITLLKLFRVLRLGRLISIMKVKDDIKLSLRLLKLVFFLALYLHFQGCLWYYIVIKDKTWIPMIDYNYPDSSFYSENLSYKYFTCLYQSVQIFAGGDIGPITKLQLAYCSFFIMIGAIINANLFGQLAVMLSTLNIKASNFQEKFDSTTSTMKNLNLPEKLQTKVTGYLTYTQSLLDSQNELKSFLDVISPSLREEVIQHIFAETLRNNSIFNFDESLIQFLTKKLKTQIHMPEDEIITQGEDGDNLYIISKGECVVLVRDHNSVTEYTNVLEPGDIFGEIALLLNCKRTATVRTSNYTTIACVSKPTFQDLCQQYIELSYKLREKLKSYNDKIKLFFYTSLRSIDFINNLDNDIIEEITYHLRQTYYNADETIFKAGDYVANLYFITRGEIELVYHINGFDIIIHNLYQGCYIGGYQILGNYNHKLTARTLSNTTLHLLSRDSLNILTNTIPEFKINIDKATKYLNTTQDPLVGFGLFRDSLGSIQPKDILKTCVIKLIGINRDFKEAGIENGVKHILERTQIKSIEIQKEKSNTKIEMFNLLTKIALKLDSVSDRVKRLESLQYENENTNNQKQPQKPKARGSVNMISSLLDENLAKQDTFEPLPPIFSRNKQTRFMAEIVTEELKSSHSSEENIKNNEQSKYTEESNLKDEIPITDNKSQEE